MTETQKRSSGSWLPRSHPSFFAGLAGIVVGLGMLGFSVYLFLFASTPAPLNLALGIVGLVNAATSLFTLQAVRVAWAFALSINGTAAVVFLFSAPRLRDAAGIPIIAALIPCLIFAAIVLMHALEPDEF